MKIKNCHQLNLFHISCISLVFHYENCNLKSCIFILSSFECILPHNFYLYFHSKNTIEDGAERRRSSGSLAVPRGKMLQNEDDKKHADGVIEWEDKSINCILNSRYNRNAYSLLL